MLSKESAKFLLDLLNTQQLAVGAVDFDAALEKVLAARKELKAILGPPVAESSRAAAGAVATPGLPPQLRLPER